ncbi:hypothetical protein [Methylosinus sporium]|uniref:hypothetical protein n=1 Tax=Methylosinus sporium TaxID=428 RepID=UPI00383A14A2
MLRFRVNRAAFFPLGERKERCSESDMAWREGRDERRYALDGFVNRAVAGHHRRSPTKPEFHGLYAVRRTGATRLFGEPAFAFAYSISGRKSGAEKTGRVF